MRKLTEQQAYEAMFVFAKGYYYRLGSKVLLAEMLGDVDYRSDGKPADLAMWEDWLAAVNEVLENPDHVPMSSEENE